MKYKAVITLTSELNGDLEVNIAFDPPMDNTETTDKMPLCQLFAMELIQYMKNVGETDGELENETN